MTTVLHRHKIERAIDVLIALLDAADGDPDLEPYLAGFHPQDDDREGDDEREDDPAERGIADYDGLIEQGFGNLWGDTVQ